MLPLINAILEYVDGLLKEVDENFDVIEKIGTDILDGLASVLEVVSYIDPTGVAASIEKIIKNVEKIQKNTRRDEPPLANNALQQLLQQQLGQANQGAAAGNFNGVRQPDFVPPHPFGA